MWRHLRWVEANQGGCWRCSEAAPPRPERSSTLDVEFRLGLLELLHCFRGDSCHPEVQVLQMSESGKELQALVADHRLAETERPQLPQREEVFYPSSVTLVPRRSRDRSRWHAVRSLTSSSPALV